MRSLLICAAALACCACTPQLTEYAADAEQACFTEREFRVASSAPGIEIAGSIMVPRGSVRASVLMITGAGPHTREQRISDTPMYTMIAEHLARRGMVVARTDARGFGASSGPADDEAYTSADRAEDNRAVLEFLRAQPEFAGLKFGLFGHSEGALIAATIAAEDDGIGFNVFLAPPTIKGDEVMADQTEDNLIRRGASPEAAAAVRVQMLRFARFLAGDRLNHEEFARIAHDFLAAHGVPEEDNNAEFAQGLISGYLSAPSYWFFAAHDPQKDLSRLSQPSIAIFAERDQNVRTSRHLPAFVAAMEAAENADFTTLVLADQDHFFLEHDGARVDQHVPGEMNVAQELYDALDAELGQRGLMTESACASP
jgi:alpha-beta hydrolase superfamily lysophospholipase